mmetsp:Transcript_7121/g.18397  ORF Transcript_7121/g.18397 Transcript_7121/m.18397 type:complete len:415 (-) Transcript_7121:109-1353(-)|eukprot:CAMPEP_0197499076 /NCGR_PEP_ID=MMETSP1311-20131121/60839_1 /TAXON_ID=464262 /ORGANISM="Genus nov. species nov., Strain RCC856" /LENGTH=414 /DNA_ID=CAMNT_0043044817 /DNA_START=117 /DNA_END=1361 /DNA_ORIENTATION=+
MSGLVGELRAINADDPVELHDLGGYDATQVQELVSNAFGTPLPCKQPVKVSFVVGAGKKGRQKYSATLPKDLIGALSSLGFEEDRGASACWECCGNYKYQHDTDKDLKFLHVFPHVSKAKAGGGGGGSDSESEYDEEEDSPEWICRSVSCEELEDYVKHNVKKFSQKRVLLKKLKSFREEFESLESKMISTGRLDAREEKIYNNSLELSEKIDFVSCAMEQMVNDGKLTKGEVGLVRDQLSEKLKGLEAERQKADAAGKMKKVAKIEQAMGKVVMKKALVDGRKPIVYAIKHEREIKKLRRELAEISKLEQGKQLMDVATVKKIGKKDELQDELEYLMAENMGWFETKASMEEMLPAATAGGGAKKKKASSSGSGGGKAGVDGWTTKASKKGATAKGGAGKAAVASNPFDLLSS